MLGGIQKWQLYEQFVSEEQNRFFFTKSKLLTLFDFPANQDNKKKENQKEQKSAQGR